MGFPRIIYGTSYLGNLYVELSMDEKLSHHPKVVVDFLRQLGKDGIDIINSAIFNAGFLTGGNYFDYRVVDPQNPADQHLFTWRKKFFSVCE